MNKLRDFFYNISDLITAVVIIALVVFIISWKIKAIAAYPEYAASLPSHSDGMDEKDTVGDNPIPDSGPKLPESDINPAGPEVTPPIDTPNPVPTNPDISNPPPKAEILTVKIPEGSTGSAIANILVQNKLIDSPSAFLKRANERKLDTKLRSGTFKIPSNATLDEVINILTGQ